MERILIGLIYYSNNNEILNYLKMIESQTYKEFIDVLITVNKSNDIEYKLFLEELKSINIQIHIFNPQSNLGYLNGVLYGYRDYRSKLGKIPKWFIISNTDILINDNRFIQTLYEKKYDDRIWVLGPSIISSKNNSFQNPHYINRTSKNKIRFLIFVHSNLITTLLFNFIRKLKIFYMKKEKRESTYLYSVHGSMFALNGVFAEKIRHVKFKGFLYSEEAFISELTRKYNKKCYYDSSLEVVHNEHSSTSLLSVGKKAKFIHSSLKFIYKEFYL